MSVARRFCQTVQEWTASLHQPRSQDGADAEFEVHHEQGAKTCVDKGVAVCKADADGRRSMILILAGIELSSFMISWRIFRSSINLNGH